MNSTGAIAFLPAVLQAKAAKRFGNGLFFLTSLLDLVEID